MSETIRDKIEKAKEAARTEADRVKDEIERKLDSYVRTFRWVIGLFVPACGVGLLALANFYISNRVEASIQPQIDSLAIIRNNIKPIWHEADLASGWVNFDNGNLVEYSGAGYLKYSDGEVYLNGLIKGGINNMPAFILPDGCRPKKRLVFATVCSDDLPCRVDVLSNGQVIVYAKKNNWVSLDNIRFSIISGK